MMEFLKAILGFVLELTIFFCIGSLLMRKMKLKAEASLALVLGYLLYFSVFEFLTVPLTLAWVPLHTLCLIWGHPGSSCMSEYLFSEQTVDSTA